MKKLDLVVACLLVGRSVGFANCKRSRQKAAPVLASKEIRMQMLRQGAVKDEIYQFHESMLRCRILNDRNREAAAERNTELQQRREVRNKIFREHSADDRGHEKENTRFQQKLLEARVKYDQDAAKRAAEKRSNLFHQRLLESRLRNDSVTTRRKKEPLYQTAELIHRAISEAKVRNDSVKVIERKEELDGSNDTRREKSKAFQFQAMLLEKRLEYDKTMREKAADKKRAMLHQRLLEAQLRADDGSTQRRKKKAGEAAKVKQEGKRSNVSQPDQLESIPEKDRNSAKYISDRKMALFHRRLLEEKLRNESIAKQNRRKRKQYNLHESLLRKKISCDRVSKKSSDGYLEVQQQQQRSRLTETDTYLASIAAENRALVGGDILEEVEGDEAFLETEHLETEKQRIPTEKPEEEAERQHMEEESLADAEEAYLALEQEAKRLKEKKLAAGEEAKSQLMGQEQETATQETKRLPFGLTDQYLEAMQVAVEEQAVWRSTTDAYLETMQGHQTIDFPMQAKRDEGSLVADAGQRQSKESDNAAVAPIPDPPAKSLIGRILLGQFKIVNKLHDGLSGKCDLYIAHHVTDHAKRHPLIVKLASSDVTINGVSLMDQMALEYGIYQDLFARLERHEQRLFVRPFDWIDPSPETDGKTGFVMECGLDNIRGFVWKNGAYKGDKLRYSMENVIQILHALHKLGLVWTELKAENFIVFGNGEIKAIDLESMAAHRGAIRMYTAETYPPEFPADKLYEGLPDTPVDYSYDLWGLGLTLFEMATGEPLFTLKRTYDVEYIKARLKDPKGVIAEAYAKLADVNEGARNVILQCLTTDPNLRRSCEDLLRDPYFTTGRRQTSSPTLHAGIPSMAKGSPSVDTTPHKVLIGNLER